MTPHEQREIAGIGIFLAAIVAAVVAVLLLFGGSTGLYHLCKAMGGCT